MATIRNWDEWPPPWQPTLAVHKYGKVEIWREFESDASVFYFKDHDFDVKLQSWRYDSRWEFICEIIKQFHIAEKFGFAFYKIYRRERARALACRG